MADVTVAVSFHNNAPTILDTVRSVFAQTTPDWRLLLLDDGSTDGGEPLLETLDDPRVTLVRHAGNAGTPARLNELTRRCETEFLARMDGDDLLHPERLERSLTALRDDASLDAVFADGIAMDVDHRPLGRRESARNPRLEDHLPHSPYIHSTMVARTEWLLANPYDEAFRRCQDQELFLRTAGKRRSLTLPVPVLYMREGGAVPARKYASSMRGTRQVLAKHRRLLPGATRARLTALTYLKQTTYHVAELTGQLDQLVAARNLPLAAEEAALHGQTIQAIRSRSLPLAPEAS